MTIRSRELGLQRIAHAAIRTPLCRSKSLIPAGLWLAGASLEAPTTNQLRKRIRTVLAKRSNAGSHHIRAPENAPQILPLILVRRRLTFDEGQARARPGQDFVDLIVKNEFSAIGDDRQDSVSSPFPIDNHRDEQRREGPSAPQELAALFQNIVFAIPLPGRRVSPALDNAKLIEVNDRLDRFVKSEVHLDQLCPAGVIQVGRQSSGRTRCAFSGVVRAKLGPANRRQSRLTCMEMCEVGEAISSRRREIGVGHNDRGKGKQRFGERKNDDLLLRTVIFRRRSNRTKFY